MVATIDKVFSTLDRRSSDRRVGGDGSSRKNISRVAEVVHWLDKHVWIPWLVLIVFVVPILVDAVLPVVIANSVSMSKEENAVVIKIEGWKIRECTYLGVQAFAVPQNGAKVDAFLVRLDQPATNRTKPIGKFNMGTWRVWPTVGAERMVVYAAYSCDAGDWRSNKIADVAL